MTLRSLMTPTFPLRVLLGSGLTLAFLLVGRWIGALDAMGGTSPIFAVVAALSTLAWGLRGGVPSALVLSGYSIWWTTHSDDAGWALAAIDIVTFVVTVAVARWARRRIRRAERQQERDFEILFELHPLPLYVYDMETFRFLRVNDATVERYGYSRDEFLRMTIMDIRPPEQVEALEARLQEVAGQRSHSGVWTHRWKDGTLRQVLIQTSVIEFDGHPARMVVPTDITERLQVEGERERLRGQLDRLARAAFAVTSPATMSQRLQTIVDEARLLIGAHTATIRLDLPGASLVRAESRSRQPGAESRFESDDRLQAWAMQRGETTLGLVSGDSIEDSRPPSAVNAGDWLASPLWGRDDIVIGLIELTAKYDGEFTDADATLLERLAQIASAAVTVQQSLDEISESNVDLERRVAERTAELEEQAQERLRFLSTMSHEFRTPLNAILGYAQILAEGVVKPGTPDFSQSLDDIVGAGEHLALIVNDLLDLTRIDAGRWELAPVPVDPCVVVRSVLSELRPLVASGVTLETRIEGCPHDATLDERSLRQILWNIAGNALKFTQAGQVTVTVTVARETGQVVFTVADTGPGIPAEVLPHIFEPYRQGGTRSREGSGLGLSISHALASMMGGEITVESAHGAGTTFHVQLPLRPAVASTG